MRSLAIYAAGPGFNINDIYPPAGIAVLIHSGRDNMPVILTDDVFKYIFLKNA